MNHSHTFMILAYGESPFLRDCIESLRKQTIPVRIRICTSTPNRLIETLASEYGIPVLVNQGEKGIGQDWNFALSSADTEYVTLTHQDDLYYPAYLEKCLKTAERNPDNLIIFTDYEEITGEQIRSVTMNLIIKRILLSLFFPVFGSLRSSFLRKLLISPGSPIPCPSVMYHRKKLDGFRFDTSFQVNMDWDAWCRLAEMDGSFCFARGILMAHRIHGQSQTTWGIQHQHRQSEDLRIYSRLWPSPWDILLAKLYAFSYHSNREK